MSSAGDVYVGTSGWHYPHWVGPFYPDGMKSDGFLAHYARFLRSVEINNTFYRLPTPEAFETWREATPDGFVFACKASRYITHMKKLRDPAASSAPFLGAVAALGDKLGPILFQLPPRWRVDVGRLTDLLATLPPGRRYAFEFRDESWLVKRVLRTLADFGAASCLYDLGGRSAPLEVTADFVYLRLHGPAEAYRGCYDQAALRSWAGRIATWCGEGLDVYCYFDNDEQGFAVSNARELEALLDGSVARRPLRGLRNDGRGHVR